MGSGDDNDDNEQLDGGEGDDNKREKENGDEKQRSS